MAADRSKTPYSAQFLVKRFCRASRWKSGLAVWGCLFALQLAAADQVEFSKVAALTNREVRVTFGAPTGSCYRIDVSTNLIAWQSWLSFPMTNRFLQHTDSAAPYWPVRFYVGRQLTGTNLVTGDHLTTDNADVVIHPVNHASLALRWSNITIYVDPAANSFQGLPKADLILYTHDHADHFNVGAISGFTNTNAIIIVPQAVYSKLSAAQKSLAIVLTNRLSTNKLGLNILAVPAYNLANTPHAYGPNNGYLLTMGGRRIYVSGDSDNTSEMRDLREIDVAFLAMNQPYTMTVAQAVIATRTFKPKVVYPYHYRNADNSFADLAGYKRQVGQNFGIEVRLRSWY